MTYIEILSFILIDQLISALIIPFNTPYILNVIQILRPELYYISLLPYFIGSLCGNILNYALGKIILDNFINSKISYKFCLLLLLSPINIIGPIITFAGSLINIKFYRFILFCIIANIISLCTKLLLS